MSWAVIPTFSADQTSLGSSALWDKEKSWSGWLGEQPATPKELETFKPGEHHLWKVSMPAVFNSS